METFTTRPCVMSDYEKERLAKLFATKRLVDKTVVGDRVVYVFDTITSEQSK